MLLDVKCSHCHGLLIIEAQIEVLQLAKTFPLTLRMSEEVFVFGARGRCIGV